jgi:hypothetical protein
MPQRLLLDDNSLATELVAGRHEALTVLFKRHNPMVFRVARRILGDSGEAEEVVQQTFLEMYHSRAGKTPTAPSRSVCGGVTALLTDVRVSREEEFAFDSKRKGCDIGYALAICSCERANSVDTCTVAALDVITAFAVRNPNCPSQSQSVFSGLVALQVTLLS